MRFAPIILALLLLAGLAVAHAAGPTHHTNKTDIATTSNPELGFWFGTLMFVGILVLAALSIWQYRAESEPD